MKLKAHTVPDSVAIFAGCNNPTPVNKLAKEYRKVLDQHYARDTGAVRDAIVKERSK